MEETLYLQLHKLPDSISEDILEDVLQSLWSGGQEEVVLNPKARLQYNHFFSFHSHNNLIQRAAWKQRNFVKADPYHSFVLACLRLLIRKSVHENLIADDFLKLFPPGLSPDLQNVLLQSLQKYQRQWKEEASRHQTTWQRPSNSHVKYGVPPSSTPSEATEIAPSMWTRQHDSSSHFSHNDNRGSTPAPVVADTSVPFVAPLLFQRVDGHDNLGMLPHLKSMIWTMQNQKSKPGERVSVITLKLHNYTKSSSGEQEVKFQLNRDTLEAMLTSMTYISNQLNNIGGPSAGPLQKRPRV